MDDALDVERLRSEIRQKYEQVVERPGAPFHFPTGRPAVARAGYQEEWLEGLSESAVASFAGVANPFQGACRS